jgi:hypothetical protein
MARADEPGSTTAPVALNTKTGGRLIRPVDSYRAVLREHYPERPALADEIDSPEWFLKQQRDPPQEGTTERREYDAAVEAMNVFYRRVRVSEIRLRGTPEDGVPRDIDPTEQATGVEFNIWTRRFDCRSKDFSEGVRDVGHLYINVWCYVDSEPVEPVQALLEGPLESPAAPPAAAAITGPAPVVSETAAAKKPRKRPGPLPGTIDRFGAADRALFPEMTELIENKNITPGEAARLLADKISGRGDVESRIRRVAERYRLEN